MDVSYPLLEFGAERGNLGFVFLDKYAAAVVGIEVVDHESHRVHPESTDGFGIQPELVLVLPARRSIRSSLEVHQFHVLWPAALGLE